MSCFLYILHSKTIDSYYIGSTCDELSERLRKHNSNHKGFTGRAHDWSIVYFEKYDSKSDALKRELQLKKWKNRKRIQALINDHSSN